MSFCSNTAGRLLLRGTHHDPFPLQVFDVNICWGSHVYYLWCFAIPSDPEKVACEYRVQKMLSYRYVAVSMSTPEVRPFPQLLYRHRGLVTTVH